MATAITKSIGTSSRNYATLQLFEDALPASLVTADETWTGEMYNDSEFTGSTIFSGATTDATRWIKVTTATGESFIDDASASTNPLKYDQSKGVGISVNAAYVHAIEFNGQNDLTIEKIQVKKIASSDTKGCIVQESGSLRALIQNVIMHNLDDGSYCCSLWDSTSKVINSLAIADNASGTGILLGYSAEARNCTAVCPSNLTSTGTGFATSYNDNVVKNCASFGFGTDYAASGWQTTTSSNNGSDSTGNPGASPQDSLTYADQFEATTSTTHDFRLKSGTDETGLLGTGVRDQTNTNDLDIVGNARSTTIPDIGCWEFQAGGGPTGRIMSSLAHHGGLAGYGGIAGQGGGLAG